MFLYKCTLVVANLVFLLDYYEVCSEKNDGVSIIKSGLEVVSPCTIGLQFFADVNNNSTDDLDVEFTPDRCCLVSESNDDCDVLNSVVGCTDVIPSGETKRLKLIAPLIDQFERRGYCTAFIDTRPTNEHNTMRNPIKINFDSHLDNKEQEMEVPVNSKPCDTDEDFLNDCQPVDCHIYYNGQRSFYDNRVKRCVDIPTCITKNSEDQDVIYDPNKNKCIEDEAIMSEDLDYIKGLIHGKDRTQKDIVIIKNRKNSKHDNDFDNDLYNFNSLYMLKEKPVEKVKEDKKPPKSHDHKIEKVKLTEHIKTLQQKPPKFFANLTTNRLTLSVLSVVVLVQCFLICTMVYFLTRNCCCNRKKVVRQYYNYRQDASVTTPLIATSNIDTETTENPYHSESSYNIDKKIKCYKAFQKDKNAKISLSDDILSKCLNRRDWRSKPIKSEAIKEFATATIKEVDSFSNNKLNSKKKDRNDDKNTNFKSNKEIEANYTMGVSQANRSSESRIERNVVNFENEKSSTKRSGSKKNSKLIKSIAKKLESKSNKEKKKERTELKDSEVVLSEKEIKCHSYNNLDSSIFISKSSKSMSKKGSNERTKQSVPSQKVGYIATDHCKKDARSESTEKSAQASFSNDSIDDFLSERGMMFLQDEDISKYSFSINSNATNETSEVSSRTSKNNIIKNVLSLLHRKSTSSDPGAKKSKESLDLELIHMSNASVYSSSNNGSECLKTFKRVKDSRTSL